MSNPRDSRPQLIRPLVRTSEHLTIVRQHCDAAHQEVDHPHCDEHFLFTPHCAACIEAEKTQHARVKATRIEQSARSEAKPKTKPPQSSRSFGLRDNLPHMFTHQPTFAEQVLDWFTRPSFSSTSSTDDNLLVDLLQDL